jgi:hypothetical protein
VNWEARLNPAANATPSNGSCSVLPRQLNSQRLNQDVTTRDSLGFSQARQPFNRELDAALSMAPLLQ